MCGLVLYIEMISTINKYYMKSKLPKIIWFTGLSGSGKTTLSKKLNEKTIKQKI